MIQEAKVDLKIAKKLGTRTEKTVWIGTLSENLLPRRLCRRMDQIQEVKIDSQRNKKTYSKQGKRQSTKSKKETKTKKKKTAERTREEKKKGKGVKIEGEEKREG